MAKKKTIRNRPPICFRVSDSEQVELLRIAELEGFDSIQKWILSLGWKRAKIINNALESGDYMEVDGKLIPFCDLPPDVEIKKKG